MFDLGKVVTVGGTIACALGIGYFMQRDPVLPPAAKATAPAAKARAVAAPQADDTETLELRDIILTSAQPEERGQGSGMTQSAPSDPATPRLGCDVTVNAQPAPKAAVALSVDAPCFANQRLTVHHSGLMFTDSTDADGRLRVTVPALSEHSVFIVAFANGAADVASTQVRDLGDYDRVAVQWSGDSGFQIHAREFGADYGQAGHVWSGGMNGGEGYIVRLGDGAMQSPHAAEIYSYLRKDADRRGTIALTVEAEVTAANCGRDVSAQSLELSADTGLRTRDLVLAMPDCGAIGDFLVLNNLVDDLKIAAR